VPVAYEADAVRNEKVKVLRSISRLEPDNVIFGQYAAGSVGGEEVAGYWQESGPESRTETFVALKLAIDNWRWQGVPFYLRTGKRLERRLTQIAVTFRRPPVALFESLDCAALDHDVLLITLQPDEGFSLHIDVKNPGAEFGLQRIPLTFRYGEYFDNIPEAYETLLHDILTGDQTLFVHADEVEAAWRAYAPIIEGPPSPHAYRAGTWGPKEAEHLAVGDPMLWEMA